MDGHDEALAIGVGFLGWKLEESDGKSAALLSIALDARVSAVWFAFGNDLERWVDLVRRTDAARANTLVDEPVKPHKTLVFVLVNSVQEARIAVEWQVDVLVAQGTLFPPSSSSILFPFAWSLVITTLSLLMIVLFIPQHIISDANLFIHKTQISVLLPSHHTHVQLIII